MASAWLYHLVPQATWSSCKASKTAYFPPTYDQDGFIHLTADPALLLTVANHFYKGVPGDWIVLKLDAGKLTAEVNPTCTSSRPSACYALLWAWLLSLRRLVPQVKYEPAAPVGNTPSAGLMSQEKREEPLFPHLYGTIDFDAVVEELPVQRSEDGTYLSIGALMESA
jgi:uncharacterized protein (DUF952 family)